MNAVKYVCLIFLLIISHTAHAQLYSTQYRPPNQDWHYVATPHFKILYSRGKDSLALRMGRILEWQYPKAQGLVGGHLQKFPVILNDYNDRSNGFVTPFNFRSEIELPPIIGKSQNPKNGNWLRMVGPHELVHAMQFSHLERPNLVSLFSPDLARSVHGAIPSGMLEGAAVYSESNNVVPQGGRGHYPLFTGTFNAVFNSADRWSMGQMMQTSTWTLPFDRHYIGGYEFTAWLQKNYGAETTDKALSFYITYPYFGYGIALKHVTGLWPTQLYNRFEDDKEAALKPENSITPSARKLNISYKGRSVHRPKWTSDSTLVFFGSFYNARPGFYRYDLKSGSMQRLITTSMVGDHRYVLADDGSTLIYSYYQSSILYDRTSKAELIEYNLASQHGRQLTKKGRAYAPFISDGRLYALHTKPASSSIVAVDNAELPADSMKEILSAGDNEVKAVSANPVNKKWAVILNKNGVQGLWICPKDSLKDALSQPPDVSFEKGSVIDPAWHPQGNKIMFSSGFSGTQQLYEYDLKNQTVVQITHASFNAMEGSYSPDGKRIAYIQVVKNEEVPFTLQRKDFYSVKVDKSLWNFNYSGSLSGINTAVPDTIAASSESWKSDDYRTGFAWLKPRSWFPVVSEVSNRDVYQLGLQFESVDLLSDQSYSAQATYMEHRFWYNLTYKNTIFYPGFRLQLENKPSYFSYFRPDSTLGTLLRQQRNIKLGVPFRFRLNQNVYHTSLLLRPQIRLAQSRFFELGPSSNHSDFTYNTIGNLYGQYNYRIQQNNRDLQPNSGLILYGEFERYLNNDHLSFKTNGSEISLSSNHPSGLKGGLITYLSPFKQWNQSLRVGLQGITQSGYVFGNQFLVSNGFSEAVLPGSRNLVSFSTRYTIPVVYADKGGFLLPLYLSNIYMVAFSNSVADPSAPNWGKKSRSVFGLGLRVRFRLSNLAFDIGVGVGYEPTRKETHVFVGDF